MPERFRHIRTGNFYIVHSRGLMRIADGEWIPSVIYVPEDPDQWQRYYTRDEETFKKNFEAV